MSVFALNTSDWPQGGALSYATIRLEFKNAA